MGRRSGGEAKKLHKRLIVDGLLLGGIVVVVRQPRRITAVRFYCSINRRGRAFTSNKRGALYHMIRTHHFYAMMLAPSTSHLSPLREPVEASIDPPTHTVLLWSSSGTITVYFSLTPLVLSKNQNGTQATTEEHRHHYHHHPRQKQRQPRQQQQQNRRHQH